MCERQKVARGLFSDHKMTWAAPPGRDSRQKAVTTADIELITYDSYSILYSCPCVRYKLGQLSNPESFGRSLSLRRDGCHELMKTRSASLVALCHLVSLHN